MLFYNSLLQIYNKFAEYALYFRVFFLAHASSTLALFGITRLQYHQI